MAACADVRDIQNATHIAIQGDSSDQRLTKKIAQLTKVVFHLNSRNEEHEKQVKLLRQTYDAEAETVLLDAKQRIAQLAKEYAQSIPLKEHGQALARLRDQHETERKKYIADFDKFRQETQERERTMMAAVLSDAQLRNNQLRSAREEFDHRMAALQEDLTNANALLEREQQEHTRQLAELSKQHEQEVASVRSTVAAEKSNSQSELLAEHQRQINAMMAKHDSDLKQLRETLTRQAEQRLSDAKLAADNEMKNAQALFNSKEQVLLSRIDDLNNQLTIGTNEASQSVTRLHRELEARDALLQQLRDQVQGLERLNQDLNATMSNVQQQLKAESKQVADLKAALAARDSSTSDLDKRSKAAETKLQTAQAEIARLAAQVDALQRDTARVNSNAQALVDEKGNIERELNRLRLEFDLERKQLQDAHQRELEAFREQAEQRLHKCQSDNERDLQQAAIVFKTKFDEQDQQHSTTMRKTLEAQSQLRSELDKASQELTSSRDRLREKDYALTTALSEKAALAAQNQDLASKLKLLQSQLDSLHKELEGVSRQYSLTKAECQQLELKLAAATAEAQRYNQAKHVEELDSLKKSLQQEHSSSLETERGLMQTRLAAMTADFNKRTEDLQRDRTALEEQIKQLTRHISTNQSEHESALKEREAKFAQEVEALRAQWSAEVEALKRTHEESLVGVAVGHEVKISALLQEHQAAVIDLEARHQAALKALLSGHMSAHESQLRALKETHDEELRQLQARLAEEHAQHEARLKEEFLRNTTSDLADMHRKHEQLVVQIRNDHQSQLAELSKQRDELQQHLSQFMSENASKSKRIAELESMNASLTLTVTKTQDELQHLGQEVLTVRREGLDALEKREAELVEAHRKQLETMMAGYQSQINRQQAEAAKTDALHKEQVHILEDELRLAEQRFQERPPRQCDVDRIAELEAIVVQQGDQITSLSSVNQRLNLEVVNREQNFNMMFKQTPNVGVLNPLQAVKKNSASSIQPSKTAKPARIDPLPQKPFPK